MSDAVWHGADRSLVLKGLVYEAKAKAKAKTKTFFSRPRTWKMFKANWDSYHYELKFALQ